MRLIPTFGQNCIVPFVVRLDTNGMGSLITIVMFDHGALGLTNIMGTFCHGPCVDNSIKYEWMFIKLHEPLVLWFSECITTSLQNETNLNKQIESRKNVKNRCFCLCYLVTSSTHKKRKKKTRHDCALCKGTSQVRRKHSLKWRNHFNSLVVLQTKTCSRKTYFATFDLC